MDAQNQKITWIDNYLSLVAADPVRAVLEARAGAGFVDEEMIFLTQQRAMSQVQFMNSIWEGREAVNLQAQLMGMGSQSAGPSPGAAMSQLAALAVQILVIVHQHQGDPPDVPQIRDNALAILRGQMPIADAFDISIENPVPYGPQVTTPPFAKWAMKKVARLLPVLVTNIIRMRAAMALPRPQLHALLGIQPEQEWGLEQTDFAGAMEAAERYRQAQDFQHAEEAIMRALELASETPPPDDDIEALMHLVALTRDNDYRLSDGALRRATEVVTKLVEAGTTGNSLAMLLSMLWSMAVTQDLSAELDDSLLRASEGILAGDMELSTRIALTGEASRLWLRKGESNRAQALIRALRKLDMSAEESLEVAQLQADLDWEFGDRDAAADGLEEALERAAGVSDQARLVALQKLVCVWPPDRPGLEAHMSKLEGLVDSSGEPARTMGLQSLVMQLQQHGQIARAREIASQVDLDQLRRNVPKGMESLVNEMTRSWRALMDRLESAQDEH